MESTGEAGQVHVTHAVQAQLADRFVFEPRTPIEVKGQGTMATFFLVDRRESARPASNVAAFAAA
jgi:adenylate cyclase